MLLLTSIPLFFFLQRYTFKNVALQDVQNILQSELNEISSEIYLDSVKTDVQQKKQGQIVAVTAEIQIPKDLTLDYQQEQTLVNTLEDNLERPVDLVLVPSRTISVVSEADKEADNKRRKLQTKLVEELQKINSSLSIDSLSITHTPEIKDTQWKLNLTLNGDLNTVFTHEQRDNLEATLSEAIEEPVSISLTIVPSLEIKSKPDLQQQQEKQEIEQTLQNSLQVIAKQQEKELEVNNILLQKQQGITLVEIDLTTQKGLEIAESDMEKLHFNLQSAFPEKKFELTLRVSQQEILRLDKEETYTSNRENTNQDNP
jgi:hypothetical protein